MMIHCLQITAQVNFFLYEIRTKKKATIAAAEMAEDTSNTRELEECSPKIMETNNVWTALKRVIDM